MKERQRWQPEEDALLRAYVRQYGAKEWGLVSERMGRALHRDPKSCQERWKNYLRPGLKKGSLTPDEQALLVSLQSRYGNKWKAIAAHLPGRTPKRLGKWWEVFKDKQLKAAAKASSEQPLHHGTTSAYEHILETFAEKHVLPPPSHLPPLPSLVLPNPLLFAPASSSSCSSSSPSSPSPPSLSLSLSRPEGWLLLLPALVQLCSEVEEGRRCWAQHRKEAAWRLSRLEQQMETEKARKMREKVEEVEAKIRRFREEEAAWLDRLEEEWRERLFAVRREAEAEEAEVAEAWTASHAKLAGLVEKMMLGGAGGLALGSPVAKDYLR
ncbi:protein rough sheath 2 homolog [Phoenix dactylifera]|uniref:Protein rough sheath 2 homolog n=1 Tax=Phoenix dactylifera TaxID=42345 RepID=A0A8B7C3X3_PHODC|nr:protein rough sheath 2 homolog [Phoenix dactylifera]